MHREHIQMKHMVNETRELRKEKTFRNFIQQPIISAPQWQREFAAYGLLEQWRALSSRNWLH